MAELLLELLSEEIPARMQVRAADDLKRLVCDGLTKNGLAFTAARAFVTPRRLALVVDGLPLAQPDVSEEKRGPRVGAPQAAIDGFLKSAGVTLDQCEQRDTGKGEFWFAVVNRKGRATAEVLKDVIETIMAEFPWPKSQRWGAHAVRWVRPLQGILCQLDGEVVPVTFGPVTAGNTTVGHRFLSPGRITVVNFADYRDRLLAGNVILDQDERRARILADAEKVAAAEGLTLRRDDGLLDEVTGLVEWPVVLLGTIDEAFMEVPAEVLITAMRSHQKYFSLLKADGSLAPRFVLVSNMVASDGGKAIVAGNQRVLRARLSDAKFFWDTDRRHRLESRLPKLAERVFYAGLGTMLDKVARIEKLAGHLAFFAKADVDAALQAARLCKADLSTEMVGEFPELQGIMGRYYARNDGLPDAVARAVAEHYAPQGPGDACPTAPASVAVALADKLDSLAGFFSIGEKPTGSKDPFALRRAALGVIRLITENGLRLPLVPMLALAVADIHRHTGAAPTRSARAGWEDQHDSAVWELLDFFADRLKVHLREQGVRHDLISAVFALGGEDDLVRLLARVSALQEFVASDDGANLLIAYRRAANIVRIEEKKDGVRYDGPADPDLLRQPEERALFERLGELAAGVAPALTAERFAEAMAILARLRQPVDAFFDKVTVNTDDPAVRANRLMLLSQIGAAMGQIADFSKIEG